MKNNWIFFVAIIFFIIRLFTSAAKKQAETAKTTDADRLRKAVADQARKKQRTESGENVRIAAEVLQERVREMQDVRASAVATEDFEAAYRGDSVQSENSAPAQRIADYTDDFGMATGVTGSSYKETAEERAAYDARPVVKRRLLSGVSTNSYRDFIIAKEIFDRPKSRR
jgi:hypothetical protein